MAYDEHLAARVRDAIFAIGVEPFERKMFGGLAFMVNGHMATGIVGNDLMVRLGPEGAERARRLRHVREMDFTGRPMKGMIFVQPDGLVGRQLAGWVEKAVAFVATLPPK